MNTSTQQASSLDAVRFIKMLIKWKKQILIVFVVSFAGAYFLTYLITPLYKSSTVVYPFNLENYSKESSTEQMVQLLKSEDVKENLINAFDLYKHYKIDTSGKSPRLDIMKQLDENITITKTEYESVDISILDKDPLIASAMCDSIITFMDKKALYLVRQKAAEKYALLNSRLQNKKQEMDSLVNLQTEISRKYGVLDYENQVLGFSREYYHSLGGGGSSSRMEEAKKNLEEMGNESFSLKENLWRVRGQYNDIKNLAEEAKADLSKVITFHNLITQAVPAEKKDSPKRVLLAMLVSLSVLAVALLVIIYQEYYKQKFDAEMNNA
jgi:uncharacterized protein involved in exopolysaccharide biosynthesis